MDDIALALACMAACLGWAAWREHLGRNSRDRGLLAACGAAFSCASLAMVTLA